MPPQTVYHTVSEVSHDNAARRPGRRRLRRRQTPGAAGKHGRPGGCFRSICEGVLCLPVQTPDRYIPACYIQACYVLAR